MSLSREDRERLGEILEENRATGAEINPAITEDHEAVDEVRTIVDEFEEQGRMRFKARDVAPLTDHRPTTVGLALSLLSEEGRVESLRNWSPRIWRIK